MMVYDVHTNLDPQTLTEVAIETYRQWLEFALGKGQIGGHTLAHPSGRYAAAISWRRTGVATISIIANERSAPEAKWIEEGTSPADLKTTMLAGVAPGKNGYRSRMIPISNNSPPPTFFAGDIVTSATGQRIGSRAGKVWATGRSARGKGAYATMSDRPGSAAWRVPAFAPYAPAGILSSLLRQDYGS